MVEILLGKIDTLAQGAQSLLPMKGSVISPSWNFLNDAAALDSWHLALDNAYWRNNAGATSSHGPKRPRLQSVQPATNPILGTVEKNRELVPYDHEFAFAQIMNNLHTPSSSYWRNGKQYPHG